MFRGLFGLLSVASLALGQAMVQHATAAAAGAAAAGGSKKVADGLERVLGSAANSTAAAAAPPTAKKGGLPAPALVAPGSKRGKHSPFEPQVTRAGGSETIPAVMPPRGGIPSPTEVESTTRGSGESVPRNPWMPKGGTRHTPAFPPFVTSDVPLAVSARGGRRSPEGEVVSAPVVKGATPFEQMPSAPIMQIAPLPPPTVATWERLAAVRKGASYEEIVAVLGKPASKIEMMEDGKVYENLRIETQGSKIGTIRLVDGAVVAVELVPR